MSEEWGVGNAKNSKAFDTATVGNQKVELIHGQNPHSRQDNTTYARWPNGGIEAFNGHRVLIGFTYKPQNYVKESHISGSEVRRGGELIITFNDKPIYGKFCREPERAAIEVIRLLPELLEHPARLWKAEEDLINRKIFYYGVPAVVTDFFGDQGNIMIKAEEGQEFPHQPWQDDELDDEQYIEVKDDILSKHIWWFRD